MLEMVFQRLSGTVMTIISGLFLAASLLLLLGKISVLIDPAWITIVISGTPLLYIALRRLLYQRIISSALLISIAMIAAIIIGELFAAGEIAFIMAIGAILEDKTVDKAKQGIRQLINLAPQRARQIINNQEQWVAIEHITRGDIIRILPGETIPVDGIVFFGSTSIDQSIMTGESLPIDKTVNDEVFSGTINCFGTIDIRATKAGEDSSLQKLIQMVQKAEDHKAPMQRIADRWASLLVPIALMVALLAYLITGDVIRAVTVLVVFCPCALALATPTSIMAAIGQATQRGVLIKSGEILENMGKVNCIAFDKTGTLTHGTLEVTDILSFDHVYPTNQLLQLVASSEARSEHPLAKAIVQQAKKQQLSLLPVTHFNMMPGKGIRVEVDQKIILCGNLNWLKENGITIDQQALTQQTQLHQQGKATLFVAIESTCVGLIALSDSLRQTAQEVIQQLHQMHVKVLLLTGDNTLTAQYFAKQIGLDHVYSELLPTQKVACIQTEQQQGMTVCMVGDGVNDAPALKIANVGVAMGSMGSDIALEAADIALMGDDITKIPYLKRLSDVTLSTIKLNITLAMAINFIAVGLSVLGILNPVTGALVHNAGSVLVVLNAARLYDRKLM